MLQQALDWIGIYRIGDLASIAGVLISLVGFLITIVNVRRSKSAAVRAEQAAQDTRDSIRLFQTVVDFTSAISVLEEIKRMHRERNWQLLPDRYATIRKLLISLRSSGTTFSDVQSATIQNALVNLKTIESQVERSLSHQDALKPAKFNLLISDDIDNLMAVLTELKTQAGG